MSTLKFVAYFRSSFVHSFGRKRIHITDCLKPFLLRFAVRASGDVISNEAGRRWRPLYSTSWIASISTLRIRPTDMVSVPSRVTARGFASHIRPTRPIYDSTQQLKSAEHFSTISVPCCTHHHQYFTCFTEDKFKNRQRFFPIKAITSAHLCFHRWNSSFRSSSNPLTNSKSSQPANVDQHPILQQLKKLENSLRFHGYSTIRIGVAVFIAIGLMVYLLRDPIRENVAVEVSQVASRSLEHEHVAIKAEEFAKSLLQTLLHDENMRLLAAQFIKQVLNSPETRKAGIDYLSSILEDPQNRQLLAFTIKQVLLMAIHDPETTAALKSVVVLILSDPESQKAARSLITAVFRHEELKAAAALFFADVLKSQAVITQATKLGKDVTFSVITDPNLKEETGKSFWQAVKYTVTPRWFSGTSSESASSPSPSEPTSEADSSEISTTSLSSPSRESSLPSSSPSVSPSLLPPSRPPAISSSQPQPPLLSSSSPHPPSPQSPSSPSSSIPPLSSSSQPPSPQPPSSQPPSSPSSSPSSSVPSSSIPPLSSSSPQPPSSQPPSSSSPSSSIPPLSSPLQSSLLTSSAPPEVILALSALAEEEVFAEEQILDEDSNILT